MILWWLVISLAFAFVMHLSRYGNWIFAMGGDKESARNAGIPTDRLTILLFVLSASSAAFVGMCQAILYNSAQVSGGMSFIFNSIISVVVGGVLLTGGFGSVIGIVLGTLTFAIVNQGIYYTGFDANWSSLIIGVLLLLAVLMNNTFRRMALSYRPKKGKVDGDPDPRAQQRQQVLRPDRRAARHLARGRRGRGPVPPGRQRRRQVDADQDPLGRPQADLRHRAMDGKAVELRQPARGRATVASPPSTSSAAPSP